MTFLLTIPQCGHAVISFVGSSGWKRLCGGLSSFSGQGEGLLPASPTHVFPLQGAECSHQTRAVFQQQN